MDNEMDEKSMGIKHRIRKACPQYCQRFNCILADDCNEECKKLDFAKALICELCDKECSEKQKMLMLNTVYYEEKKKAFSQNVMDGINEIKLEHTILERRYKELKTKLLLLKWYDIGRKTAIVSEGNKVIKEILMMRKFMDMLHFKYDKEVDLEGKGN